MTSCVFDLVITSGEVKDFWVKNEQITGAEKNPCPRYEDGCAAEGRRRLLLTTEGRKPAFAAIWWLVSPAPLKRCTGCKRKMTSLPDEVM